MEQTKSYDELIQKITTFINEIGITCMPGSLTEDTFLPGIDIKDGKMIYDTQLLKYPGDLLHDAGHLAVLLPNDRAVAQSPDKLSGDLHAGGAEMATICWSWAAMRHLNLEPEVIFHPDGYRGGAESLKDAFNSGSYIGLPLLQWFGMTKEPGKNTSPDDVIFPNMKYWLRK